MATLDATRGRPSATGFAASLADFPGVARSEWTKFRSVRSSYWTLAIAVVATVGLGALLSLAVASRVGHPQGPTRATLDPALESISGIFLAQLAIGVLGVLVVASEYTTGLARVSAAAVPSRNLLLAAKLAVFGAVVLVVGEVSSFAAFFAGQAVLSTKSLQTTLAAPGVARAVASGGLYLLVVGLLGLGLAGIVRRTAGAIAALFGLLLVLPLLVLPLPSPWSSDISSYLPSSVGMDLLTPVHAPGSLSSLEAGLIFAAYAVAALVGAFVLTNLRDV